MHNAPINLEYEASSDSSEHSRKKHWIAYVVAFYIYYALIMIVLGVMVPKFQPIFMSFQLLPPRTLFLLDISNICCRYYLWAVLAPIPALAGLANDKLATRTARRWIHLATFVFVVAFVLFTIVALFDPLLNMMHGITALSSKK